MAFTNPFSRYTDLFQQLHASATASPSDAPSQPALASRHRLFDTYRHFNDLVLTLALVWLDNTHHPQATNEQSLQQYIQLQVLRCTDAELLSQQSYVFYTQLQQTCQWLLLSGRRELHQQKVNEWIRYCLTLSQQYEQYYSACKQPSVTPTQQCTVATHQHCRPIVHQPTAYNVNQKRPVSPSILKRTINPSKTTIDASPPVHNTPANLSETEFLLACRPLWNTVSLTEVEATHQDEDDSTAPASITFHCILCETQLIDQPQVQQVRGNYVYSVEGADLRNVMKKPHERFVAVEAETSIDKSGEEDEDEDAVAAVADDSNPDGIATGTGKQKLPTYQAMTVACCNCQHNVGQYNLKTHQYRLTYIHRLSGKNYMYVQGTVDYKTLPPLVAEAEEAEEEEEEAEPEDEDGEGDEDAVDENGLPIVRASIKPAKEVERIFGLPHIYTQAEQATMQPFPRYGAADTSIAWLEQIDSSAHPVSSHVLRPLTSQRTNAQSSNGIKRPPTQATVLLSPTKMATVLQSHPDQQYQLCGNGQPGDADTETSISLLSISDSTFNSRRMVDALNAMVTHLFSHFSTSQYAVIDPQKATLPVFLPFFTHVPDFTLSRGTTRYVFHYLTARDDSQIRRVPYTYKKLIAALEKLEFAVVFLAIGGYTGHRLVIVRIGETFQIYQSNENLKPATAKFTLVQWLHSKCKWSLPLTRNEFLEFLHHFEEARKNRLEYWNQVFTIDGQGSKEVQAYAEPQDQYTVLDVEFATVKLSPQIVKQLQQQA